MILLLPTAWAGEGSVDALIGVRTSPDTALEQPVEWEPEVEPTALGALAARWRASNDVAWWAIEGGGWGFAPEADANLVAIAPRGGFGMDVGEAGRFDAGARYDVQAFPLVDVASSGRAEAVLSGSWTAGDVTPGLQVVGIDRRYPFEPAWSFRSAEAGASLAATFGTGRAKLDLSGQFNETDAASGTQLRATLELGVGGRTWEVWGNYGLISADAGQVQVAARPQFTPIGDYSADADALSAGGFLQHRVQLGISATTGKWTARASALGRLRTSERRDLASFRRTVHAQLDLQRPLQDRLDLLVTTGGSSAELVGGASFVDVYLWSGVRWNLGGDTSTSTPGSAE